MTGREEPRQADYSHDSDYRRVRRVFLRRRLLAIGITVAAVTLATMHTVFPRLRVDWPTLVLLGIALLPWLGLFLDAIELPGGWKVQYHRLAERLERTEREVVNASQSAQVALGAAIAGEAQSAPVETVTMGMRAAGPRGSGDEEIVEYWAATQSPVPHPRVAPEPGAGTESPSMPATEETVVPDETAEFTPRPTAVVEDSLPVELALLVDEYARIRGYPRGRQRSDALNRVFGQLVALTPLAAGFDAKAAMTAPDPGIRLAGYAHAYARPAAELADLLVKALGTVEDVGFNQYWAIRALGRVLARYGRDVLSDRGVDELLNLTRRFPESSERHYELARMIDFYFPTPKRS